HHHNLHSFPTRRSSDLAILNLEQADIVCVIGIDVLSPVAYAGFNQIGAMSQDGARPFSQDRDGMTCGEGAFGLVAVKSQHEISQDRKSTRLNSSHDQIS